MTDTAQLPSSATQAESTDSRNRLVIGLLLVSTFVVFLNETIIGVALPRFMQAFDIPASSAQWLSTAFMLTMAVVIPVTGFLLQRFNTRPMFILAMSLFTAGTLLAALAPGFSVLLVARVIQASGTAIMMPLLMTTVMILVPPARRGRTIGNISIVISVAPAIGPAISGIVLNFFEWRWLFFLVLPFAVAALLIGTVRVRNVTTPIRTHFDVASVILSAFGFGGVVYGISNLGSATADTIGMVGWLPLGVGVVTIVLFVLRQLALQKRDSALLDLGTFRARTFTFSIVIFVIAMIAFVGTILILPIYMQTVLGVSTLSSGLLLLPGGLLMGALAPIVGRLYDRFGPTELVVIGSILLSATLWAMTLMTQDTSIWWVFCAYLGLSIALAVLFTPLFTASLSSLAPRLYSHGSATLGSIQQVAGAAGGALMVTIMTAQATHLRSHGATTIAGFAGGIHVAFIVAAGVSLLAIPAAFFVRRTPSEDGAPSPHGSDAATEGVSPG